MCKEQEEWRLFPWASLHAPGHLSVGDRACNLITWELRPFCDQLVAVQMFSEGPPPFLRGQQVRGCHLPHFHPQGRLLWEV